MEHKIQVPKAFMGEMTFSQFEDLLGEHNCVLEGATASGDWIVSSDNSANLLWLE